MSCLVHIYQGYFKGGKILTWSLDHGDQLSDGGISEDVFDETGKWNMKNQNIAIFF